MSDHLLNTIAEALGEAGHAIQGEVVMKDGTRVEFQLTVLAVHTADGQTVTCNSVVHTTFGGAA